MSDSVNFTIPVLGKATIKSPLNLSQADGDFMADYVTDDELVLSKIEVNSTDTSIVFDRKDLLEKVGPREKIYFDASKVHAAIITCGGLCPGLNDVIRSIVMCLHYHYGVRRISGIRFGYRGLLPEYGYPTMDLTPNVVAEIHRHGGTLLGSSRGGGSRVEEIVDSLERMNVSMLFTIGGDGTQKGAFNISQEIEKRGLRIAVIGIPKTIDNDLLYVDRTFGFDTAVSMAVPSVSGAHVEAHDAVNGVGIVKVMGRESGFIAAHTALAMNDVNFVLIPEVPFDLEGPKGLFAQLEQRLESRNHAVILAAEGAGQEYLAASNAVDASGNAKIADIGIFLKGAIEEYFKKKNKEINLKYIDPSYLIRSAPANPSDALYCARLGTAAAHAAMAGKTAMVVSLVNNQYVHVPMTMVTTGRKHVDPESDLWRDVINGTGQPALMKN
jgi:6-phosphofructokinase 1